MSESRFKPPQFQNPASTELETTRIVKTQNSSPLVVEEYQTARIGGVAGPRNRFAANPAAAERGQSHFHLSQLTREALGLEEEERRRIEQSIRERVLAETETAKAIGIKEGYAEGLERGRREALEEYRRSSAEKLARLMGLLDAMDSAKDRVFEANQKFLVDLSFRVGRSVLLRELATDREYVTRLSRELIERIGLRENLTVKLNPADIGLLDELKANLQEALGAMRNLAVETSAEVASGGVILETEWGALDASLDTQLANLQAALQAPPRLQSQGAREG